MTEITAPSPAATPTNGPNDEPQTRERERSGILGEPAGVPPGSSSTSDGSERDDPLHDQVPHDGKDHWRR